jgi:hypothetical protein
MRHRWLFFRENIELDHLTLKVGEIVVSLMLFIAYIICLHYMETQGISVHSKAHL